MRPFHFQVFAELFDAVINYKHGGFKPTDKHLTDLDASKVGHVTLLIHLSLALHGLDLVRPCQLQAINCSACLYIKKKNSLK